MDEPLLAVGQLFYTLDGVVQRIAEQRAQVHRIHKIQRRTDVYKRQVVVCILCRGVPGGYDTTGRCAQVRVQRTSVGDGALRTKQRYNCLLYTS